MKSPKAKNIKSIAYLGPTMTYTHMAAAARFGQHCRYVDASTVDEIFHLVEREKVDYGVVPIENSIGGAVTHTLDRFVEFKKSPVRIQGELHLSIKHHLLFRKGTQPKNIRVIVSHPQAFAQCDEWLHIHFPRAERIEAPSTGYAVHYLIFKSWSKWKLNKRAAIGPKSLAKEHSLRAIRIPQEHENTTRFLILGLGDPKPGRNNKTSIMFSLRDKAGALHDALMPFKRNKVSLTKIESRPSGRKAWEYLFFIDVLGHKNKTSVKCAIQGLSKVASTLQILGSYPSAKRD